ncbi:hypothetical protein NDU88_003972 [Pleurodeles waltl]|uniref:Uncharacterized protein n=1 Tax=Pleurodeles waltl TaxID=8319 RepID=A0AAV7TQK0_PLEWA|nr:hypothetical protein NDU88_003972 [Pleurodeles waltl]
MLVCPPHSQRSRLQRRPPPTSHLRSAPPTTFTSPQEGRGYRHPVAEFTAHQSGPTRPASLTVASPPRPNSLCRGADRMATAADPLHSLRGPAVYRAGDSSTAPIKGSPPLQNVLRCYARADSHPSSLDSPVSCRIHYY